MEDQEALPLSIRQPAKRRRASHGGERQLSTKQKDEQKTSARRTVRKTKEQNIEDA